MKKSVRIVVIIAATFIVFLFTGTLWLRIISHKALPDYDSDIPLQGLHNPVEVFRDAYAIPHVYARDEHDMYMAVGYLLAQDRLWQMDLLRRITQGRISEIFGEEYVDTDLLLRSLRFEDKSEKIFAATDSALQQSLISFSSGINQYIQQNPRKLPPEFSILRYKPDLWTPLHTLNMIGYMAWDLKTGWNEIILMDIISRIDSIRYQQFIPDPVSGQTTVFPVSYLRERTSMRPALLLENILTSQPVMEIFSGSNNWAVSGSKSITGEPLLANDMHLTLNVPGIWYQMHQNIAGTLNVSGVVLPGAPFIICGHNDSIAWGMTNTCVDNLDFYEERINPANPEQYEYLGEWRNMEIGTEVINIRGGSQVEKKLAFTLRGAVVSDFLNFPDKVISMHWVGDEMSDEIRAIYLLNRADNWEDFKEALKTFTSISQNINYADKQGNIGLYCAAGVPLRKRDALSAILPGWTDEYDWRGFVPFEQLPYQFNPEKGFVVSANNRTVELDYPYHIGTWYDLPNRYDRITEMLTAKQFLSLDDFKEIQLDQQSNLAGYYIPFILQGLEDAESLTDIEMEAVQILKAWDCKMLPDLAAPLIFEATYHYIMKYIFSDELGNVYGSFAGNTISRTAMYRIMENDISPWFDDIATAGITENRNDITVRGFKSAVSDLQSRLKGDPDSWKWGSLHTLELKHPMSELRILDRIFGLSRGPYGVGGSFHTVSKSSYEYTGIFNVNHGTSQRHIYDLSDWDNSVTVIPTGNSGIPASRHYCDQTGMYVTGDYHPEFFTRGKVEEHAEYHMYFTNN